MITLGLVDSVDANGVYVTMPGSKGVLRGPYKPLQYVTAGQRVMVIETDDGENVVVGVLTDGTAVNAKTFGAKGDGVTDDTAAFQAALDACTDGGVLTAPVGDYLLSSTLVVDKSLTIAGPFTLSSAGNVLSARADDVTFADVTFNCTDTWGNLFTTSNPDDYSGWTFRRCKFDGIAMNCQKSERYFCDGTLQSQGTGVTYGTRILNCEFTNFAQNYTVELAGVFGALVDGCWIHDTGLDINSGDGIKVLHGSDGVTISNCVIDNCTRDGIDVYDAQGVTISACTIRGNAALGIDAKWSTFETEFEVGRLVVVGNRIIDNAGGINGSVPNAVFSGNYISNPGSYNLRVGSANDDSGAETLNVAISGNVCCNGTYGIVLSNAVQRAAITGNVCFDNTVDGIAMSSGVDDCTLTGNVCFGNTDDGIQLAGDGHVLAANRTQDGYPMELQGSGDPEGVVTAPVASTFRRLDGGTSTSLYVKESGTGNTGWVAK